jgi:hypothetical protein
MSANTTPIFPLTPVAVAASLAAVSACTTRGPIAYASLASTPCFAVQLSTTTSAGLRVDAIVVKGISTSITAATVAQTVIVWLTDGITAYPVDEILVTAVTPSTTVASFTTTKTYTTMVIPPGSTLWVSTTVATTASTTALGVSLYGGAY